MKNNIVTTLCRLRRQFDDSAQNQAALIGHLAGIKLDSAVDDFSKQTVNTGDGIAYQIGVANVQGQKMIEVATWANQAIHNAAPDHFDYLTIEVDGGVDLDQYIEGLNMKVADLVKDLQLTQHFNDLVSVVSGMFVTTPNVDISAVSDLIANSIGSSDTVVSQFKDYLILNAPTGKLSQYSFLKLLEKVMDNGKAELEDGKLTLNTNSPSFIANAIGTIILSVISTIGSIISSILSVVGGVIGIIASAVINIASALIRSINNVVRTNITVKSDSSANIFDSPIGALSDSGTYSSAACAFEDLTDDIAKVLTRGPLTYYLWANSKDGVKSGFNCNVYFTLDLHPERTAAWLVQELNVVVNGGYQMSGSVSFSCWFEPFVDFPAECYYTTEEVMALSSASDYELTKSALFNAACIGAMLIDDSLGTQMQSLQNNWGVLAHQNGANNSAHIGLVMACLQALACYKVNGSLDAWVNTYSNAGEQLTDCMINIFQFESHRSANRGDAVSYANWYDKKSAPGLGTNMKIYTSYMFNIFNDYNGYRLRYPVDVESSSIPTDGMFAFQNARWSNVVAALAIVLTITAAVMVTTIVAKVRYKKWAVKKQLTEKSKLTAARNAYIDSDTGEIVGDQSDYNAFYKQVKKYNKWGRILGYGTYDAGNDWTNAPEDAISFGEIPSNSAQAASILSDLTDDGALNLSTIRGESPVSITDVLRLIKHN